jgi:hypothetical protein
MLLKQYRLGRANSMISALEPEGGFQPSQVVRGTNAALNGTNVTDEEAIPEQYINNTDQYSPSNTIFTDQQLEALAATDEIEDVLERIVSYIAIQPDLGSSFAYVDFKPGFELPVAVQERVIDDLQRHWHIAQTLLFGKASSLTIGISRFISMWLTYGKLHVGIIRKKQFGEIIDIHIQTSKFKEVKTRGATYWLTDLNQTIFEQEDMFEIDYAEINPYVRSYVASLMRTYNLWNTTEHTRVANAIMAAQFRTVYTVPTAGLGKIKARQKMSSVMGLYKRDIRLDDVTGEVRINGENKYPVNTELWVAETSSGSVKVDNPGDGNVQLNSMDLVEYQMRKYYKKAKLPMSKYEAVDSGYLNGLSEIDEDERQFKLYIQNCRAVLANLFLNITWRLISVLPDYSGREDIHSNICMNWYDEPEHKTDSELLDASMDILDKIKDIVDKYKELLTESGFNERQATARINVLRIKLMRKHCPEMLEQTQEDYRNVPDQENPNAEDNSTTDDFGSDEGTDDFSNWDDDNWDNEFSGGDDNNDDWSMPEEANDSFDDANW